MVNFNDISSTLATKWIENSTILEQFSQGLVSGQKVTKVFTDNSQKGTSLESWLMTSLELHTLYHQLHKSHLISSRSFASTTIKYGFIVLSLINGVSICYPALPGLSDIKDKLSAPKDKLYAIWNKLSATLSKKTQEGNSSQNKNFYDTSSSQKSNQHSKKGTNKSDEDIDLIWTLTYGMPAALKIVLATVQIPSQPLKSAMFFAGAIVTQIASSERAPSPLDKPISQIAHGFLNGTKIINTFVKHPGDISWSNWATKSLKRYKFFYQDPKDTQEKSIKSSEWKTLRYGFIALSLISGLAVLRPSFLKFNWSSVEVKSNQGQALLSILWSIGEAPWKPIQSAVCLTTSLLKHIHG